jgi:2-polyprenyl-3-methyl-5-hydroxy-6-metoxy-1,4-benzoquinol methylase
LFGASEIMRDLQDYQTSYQQLPFENTQIKFRKRKVLETLKQYQAKSILEIGCGLEPIFNDYHDFDFCAVIEPCEQFYENASEQAAQKDNVKVVRGLLEENTETLSAHSYDLILLSCLLHEIPDATGLLSSIAKLCSEKTIVHINVPNAKSFHRLLALEMGLIDSIYEKSDMQKKMQQSHTFDLNQLETLVTGLNFTVVEQGSFFIKPFTHAQMAQLQEIGIANDLLLDGLYNLSKHFPEYGSEIFMNIQLKAHHEQ